MMPDAPVIAKIIFFIFYDNIFIKKKRKGDPLAGVSFGRDTP